MRNSIERCIRFLLLAVLWVYQRFISESFKLVLGGSCHTCRFYPTCSEYARQAFLNHSVLKGLFLSVRRFLKCHPWHEGGLDLLPKKNLD